MRCLPGTIAIYDNHVDDHFNWVHVTNFETAFYTHGGRFYNCSAWNLDMSVVGTSVFANVARGHQSLFVNCSVDTYRFGFVLGKGPWGYASCAVSNMTWITNKNFYNDEMQAKYPRTIFLCDEPEEAQFYVVGAQVPWEGHLAFSNGEMPNSIFMNVRFPIGTHGIPYMRNDTDTLKALASVKKPTKTALNASDDFDLVTAPYTYDCSLCEGEGGNNVPPICESGVLEVQCAGEKIVQRFTGLTTCAQRIFDGTKWGQWIVTSNG